MNRSGLYSILPFYSSESINIYPNCPLKLLNRVVPFLKLQYSGQQLLPEGLLKYSCHPLLARSHCTSYNITHHRVNCYKVPILYTPYYMDVIIYRVVPDQFQLLSDTLDRLKRNHVVRNIQRQHIISRSVTLLISYPAI